MSGRGDFLHLFFIQEEADLVRYSIENLKRIEVHGGSRGGKGEAGVHVLLFSIQGEDFLPLIFGLVGDFLPLILFR